ncbi:MAG: PspA/IM30 family protein [Chromatiales bacterium]|nr:PspA/IM30 family protein [Chromatiales bacterium]
MALITRLSRLFKADMHAVLDRIEEPQQMLQQAIREMEQALYQEQQQLKLQQHEQVELQRQMDGLLQKVECSQKELDLCLNSGKEELARGIIRRRLERERLAGVITQRQQLLGEKITQLSNRIEQQRNELEGMRQKAELVAAAAPVSDHGRGVGECAIRVSEDEVEIALLREKERRAAS